MQHVGAGSSMYVFRDAHHVERGPELVQTLARDLDEVDVVAEPRLRQQLVGALIRAGEIESAFADAAAESPDNAPAALRAAEICDVLADRLLSDDCPTRHVDGSFRGVPVPDRVRLSPHEGFAYYALHPLAFADLVDCSPLSGRRAFVVGIRSIGATLSAVAAARLRTRGALVERVTVRPTGHPFARSLSPGAGLRERWRSAAEEGASFFVADEGPGLSGSSFLAVGDALAAAGVPSHRVVLMCSHAADPRTLLAPDASTRWSAFRSVCCESTAPVPGDAGDCLVGDGWRRLACGPESRWPASWPQMERLKFLTKDRRRLMKFEGLGPYGTEALRRADVLSGDGWAPPAVDEGDGFLSYPLVGIPERPQAPSEQTLLTLARYCAARTRLFPASVVDGHEELVAMLRTNVRHEFGADLPRSWVPAVEYPVLADARMQPYEWLRSPSGSLMKVDAVSHGDDHVFPGPTDIAWDLAGAIVEWRLDGAGADWFLRCYRHAAGEDARARLGPYLRAYALFRMGYCKMAAAAVGVGREARRLAADYRRYRALAQPPAALPR